jgi:hypothetical protein
MIKFLLLELAEGLKMCGHELIEVPYSDEPVGEIRLIPDFLPSSAESVRIFVTLSF